MRIAVSGASGLIGQHVVHLLLQRHHQVLAIVRTKNAGDLPAWFDKVEILEADISHLDDARIGKLQKIDAMMHLAWDHLDDFNSLDHCESTLFTSYQFLKNVIAAGCDEILVTGTCLEYGLQNGSLVETLPAEPVTSYGLAKDCLRRMLENLKREIPFKLTWARIFYVQSSGTHSRGLFHQLENALVRGDKCFPLTLGEQLRDYLSPDEIGELLVKLVESRMDNGIVNVCSGVPVSVRRKVEDWLKTKSCNIQVELGRIEYPRYEPLAFWGCNAKMQEILGKSNCK